jgi:thiopurine S-methyltransferase
MNKQFWLNKWATNDIGFHEGVVNAMLMNHFNRLSQPNTIFVPLCGKAVDIIWLMKQGVHVIGVELSETAIQQLFHTLKIDATVTPIEDFKHYKGPMIDVFVGDLFDLTPKQLPSIDAVYDRASMVALPKQTRIYYAAHLHRLTNSAKQLLVSFEYPEKTLNGPPFSVPESEINTLYGPHYRITHCDTSTLMVGTTPIDQNVFILHPK